MKVRVFLFLFLYIATQPLYSQDAIYNSVLKDSLYYAYDEYGELYFNPNLDFYYLENVNEPALPYYNLYIDIPDEYEFVNYEYNVSTSIALTGIHISPNIEHFCYNDSILEEKFHLEYSDSVYPLNVLSYINTYIGRNGKKISFKFSPLVYNNYDSLLYSVESLSLTLNFKNGHSIVKHYGGSSDELLEFSSQFNNNNVKEIIETFNPNDSIEYLVVTSTDFYNAFKPLVEWKTLKGVPAKIISLDSIYNMYKGIPNEIKIKRYIKELYDKTNKRLKYVLLGGDDEIVPVKYCQVLKISDIYNTTYKCDVPTDIFYGCFDGDFLWDANNDGISGDVSNDNIDYFPEVYVSRFPARTISHINAMVYKTLNYEKNPPIGNWCHNVLNTGSMLARKNDAEYKSDTISKYTFKKYLESPYIFKLFDSNTSYLNGGDYELNLDNIHKELSRGYHFVNVLCHGQNTYWEFTDTERYKYGISYALDLYTSRPMHIATMACHTNSFHLAEPCLSEAFMRNKNCNVVTYWGSSSYGWTSTSKKALGPSDNLILNYYDLLLNDNSEFKNYAELTTKAKMKLKNIGTNSSDHWLFFSVNSMGDPELPIYTRDPKEFNEISFECKEDNSLIIKFSEKKVNVTICECTNTTNPYYKIYKNISDSCIVDKNLESYIITLSKPNYIPCTIYLSMPKIQNKIFIGNNNIYSEKLNIGCNIVDSLPSGNVILETGKISLNSSKGTYIKNGFIVNNGTKLYVK